MKRTFIALLFLATLSSPVFAGFSLFPHTWTDKVSGIEIMMEVTPPGVISSQEDYLPIFIDDSNEKRAGIVLGSSIVISAYAETGDNQFCDREFYLYATDCNAPGGMRLLVSRTVAAKSDPQRGPGVYLRCEISAKELERLPPFFALKAYLAGARGHRKPQSLSVNVFVYEPGPKTQRKMKQAEISQKIEELRELQASTGISTGLPNLAPALVSAPAPAPAEEYTDFTGSVSKLSQLILIFNDQKGNQVSTEFTVEITGQKVSFKTSGQFTLRPCAGWQTFGADFRVIHPGFKPLKYENGVAIFVSKGGN